MIGLMHFRDSLALASLLFFLGSVCAPPRALAADEKESCLAAADQGQSLRDDGKYAVAREQFVICSRGLCPKLVHDQCTEWLRQLDDSIPTVLFVAKDDQGTNVPAAHVFADGKPVASNLDGKPVALDPGPHDVRFERDNPSQSVALHVVLRAGEKNREISAAFPAVDGQAEKPLETPPPPSPPASELPQAAPSPPPSPSPSSAFWNGRSITSLSLLGAGAVSVGLGVDFGFQSQSEASQGDSIRNDVGSGGCGMNPANPNKCKNLNDARDAQNRDAVLNIVFYAGGGALAAGAVAAWLLWPKSAGESKPSTAWIAPMVTSNHAGVNAGGTF